ncbi:MULTISPECIES: hypothetical protein [unclassified Bacillus (in: firmicutes)]|uniref:hypothetical protein n=1 Tax=unclassified Bacillus (in: firmicutes) TaxID=185979 RepID=UPI0008F17962|nr:MULTISPECIES: hypothetical protein [unclassified Bacillus (in: firmicutes)]SFJ59212.1 hypothetical protein SAMN04488574_11840 [Bacillus sp. 71mf]SFS68740.1 hypothetical protein SAMN04488145_102496 [Bacillus sp. 103mf]
MNNMPLGLTFISVGILFLLLSITLSLPIALWAVLLSTSIILNISGTVILMRFIKTVPKVK